MSTADDPWAERTRLEGEAEKHIDRRNLLYILDPNGLAQLEDVATTLRAARELLTRAESSDWLTALGSLLDLAANQIDGTISDLTIEGQSLDLEIRRVIQTGGNASGE